MADEPIAPRSPGEDAPSMSVSYYLMKAEPDSRIVKGKDVKGDAYKFSVDDFEAAQVTAWEGVRNYEARNIMQGMKVGDKVLFYHSNTKSPGIAALAEVSKEAYPDHTAWDETHPYHDPKSNAASPKWYMVDLRFVSRTPHFVSLALLRHLSSLIEAPEEIAYLTTQDLQAIKDMALLNKGRLSVQKVQEDQWDAINKIAKEGDGGIVFKPAKKQSAGIAKGRTKVKGPKKRSQEAEDAGEAESDEYDDVDEKGQAEGKKRKIEKPAREGERKSKRVKK